MVYPAETYPFPHPWLRRDYEPSPAGPRFLSPRKLSRSASKRKTGNANAYIGTWQFVIQENLAACRVPNDCVGKSGKARETGGGLSQARRRQLGETGWYMVTKPELRRATRP